MRSSRRVKKTSGTRNTATSRQAAPVIVSSEDSPTEPSESQPFLETGLEEQPDASAPESPAAPELPAPELTETSRRFTLIVTGYTPGVDPVAEREIVLKTMERALMGLHVTNGIELAAAAYRSDPNPPSSTSPDHTDTAPDAPVTAVPTEADGSSPTELSSDGSSGTSPSDTAEASTSPSASTPS